MQQKLKFTITTRTPLSKLQFDTQDQVSLFKSQHQDQDQGQDLDLKTETGRTKQKRKRSTGAASVTTATPPLTAKAFPTS